MHGDGLDGRGRLQGQAVRRGFGVQPEPVEHAARPVRRDQVAAQRGVRGARHLDFCGEPIRLEAHVVDAFFFGVATRGGLRVVQRLSHPEPVRAGAVRARPEADHLAAEGVRQDLGEGRRDAPVPQRLHGFAARDAPRERRVSVFVKTVRLDRPVVATDHDVVPSVAGQVALGVDRGDAPRPGEGVLPRVDHPAARHALAVQKELPA